MDIADIDGNGTIDISEFSEVIKKIDSTANLSEEQVKEIFDSIDTDGNGELSTEEFASALHQAITSPE